MCNEDEDNDYAWGLGVEERSAPLGTLIPAPDLELLELAARAIGAVRIGEVDGEEWLRLDMADGSVVYGWNPLRHSDDTFTMMVRLHLLSDHPAFARLLAEEQALKGAEPVTAARRAATRAAAEIGKSMTAQVSAPERGADLDQPERDK